jgi:toxin ParE1/3/4
VRLRYTVAAREDLRDIVRYGLAESLGSARTIIDEIDQRLRALATQPQSGRKGREPGTREWVLAPLPFIAVYRLESTELHIINIVHGARQWPPER